MKEYSLGFCNICNEEMFKHQDLYTNFKTGKQWHLDCVKKEKKDMLVKPIRHSLKQGRNQLCACGSRKKYKNCCLRKQ